MISVSCRPPGHSNRSFHCQDLCAFKINVTLKYPYSHLGNWEHETQSYFADVWTQPLHRSCDYQILYVFLLLLSSVLVQYNHHWGPVRCIPPKYGHSNCLCGPLIVCVDHHPCKTRLLQ